MTKITLGGPLLRQMDDAEVQSLSAQFQRAAPFPHVVIDDFLSAPGRAALETFPSPKWPHWRLFLDEYQKEKRTCADASVIPPALRELIAECQRPAFLRLLERVTGCKMLTVDPYLDGGGLHCSGPGGVLTPHTDFHYYERLGLYRMLNVLIYLNDDWQYEDGGRLELYRKGDPEPAVSVVPTYGRAVIFRTDDQSVHGFANPVAEGKWRKSVALYYYSTRESASFSGDTSTFWQTHGPRLTGARLKLFDALIFASRAFSKLAFMVNPNQR